MIGLYIIGFISIALLVLMIIDDHKTGMATSRIAQTYTMDSRNRFECISHQSLYY